MLKISFHRKVVTNDFKVFTYYLQIQKSITVNIENENFKIRITLIVQPQMIQNKRKLWTLFKTFE